MNKKKFNVGDRARINRTSNVLKKGNYLCSSVLLEVSKVLVTLRVTYRLRDMEVEEILGGFYDYELQKDNNNGIHQIEKILKSLTRRDKRQLLVRCPGYNSYFFSWIAAEEIHNA